MSSKIFITKYNSIYTEETTLIDDIAVPMRVHSLNVKSKKLRLGITTEPELMMEKVIREDKDVLKTIFASGDKNGLIFAAGNAALGGRTTVFAKGRPSTYPKIKNLSMAICNIAIGKIALGIGKFRHISTDATACISGHSSLKLAKLLIDSGELDRVIILSGDNGLNYDLLEFFSSAGACTVEKTEGTEDASFRIGQGANYIVVENEESIKETKSTPVAEILKVSTSAEHHTNPLGISSSGDGYRRVLSDTYTKDVKYIKLHDTKTPNNAIEKKVISEFTEDYIPLTYKDRIGHTLGSASNIEMCIALEENKGTILALSAGMGNVFSSVLLRTID